MSMTEGTGSRRGDLLYSAWHRPQSIRRWVSADEADALGMVNLDVVLRCERWVEYARCCSEPLVLVETAIGTHQTHKSATVTMRMAKRMNPPLEAYIALLDPNATYTDVERFRVRMIHPRRSPWVDLTPEQWAHKLVEIRARAYHADHCPNARHLRAAA